MPLSTVMGEFPVRVQVRSPRWLPRMLFLASVDRQISDPAAAATSMIGLCQIRTIFGWFY